MWTLTLLYKCRNNLRQCSVFNGEIELVWHLGFQLTPVHEHKNIELLLSSIKESHYEHAS